MYAYSPLFGQLNRIPPTHLCAQACLYFHGHIDNGS